MRGALSPIGGLYGLTMAARNAAYDRGRLRAHRLAVPVICVGNLSVGGTGKTPMVIWLCRYLERLGRRPGILSRGYKAQGEDNDETRLLREALPETPVVVDADRVRGGRRAMEKAGCDVLVLDDGFQHRRLARDLDIVLVDATRPFTMDVVLPAGRLRERPTGLRRAGAVVLTRTDLAGETATTVLEAAVRNLTPRAVVAWSRHEPAALLGAYGEEYPLDWLKGRAVLAFCGLGNPQAFVGTLEGLGVQVVGRRDFPDHHHYSPGDLAALTEQASRQGAQGLVTTEKDWVKLRDLAGATEAAPGQSAVARLAVVRLRIETAVTRGREELEARIAAVVRS